MEKTGIQYIPVSSWTMEKEGAKQVEITGLKDKQQITTVFAAEKDSYLSGKTDHCLSAIKFPSGWHITYTASCWANEKTTLEYIRKVLLPYVDRRHELHLLNNIPALVIYDKFKAQCTEAVIKVLRDNNVHILDGSCLLYGQATTS